MQSRASTSSVFSAPTTPRQIGTPEVTRIDNDSIIHRPNPFDTPFNSRPASMGPESAPPSSSAGRPDARPQRYFHSRRLPKGVEIEKPWLAKKDPREKWHTIIPLIGLFVGLCTAGFIVWDGYRRVVNHKYCLILDEDWSSGINRKIWTPEVELGGFGYVTSLQFFECNLPDVSPETANSSKRPPVPTTSSSKTTS